MNLAKQFPGMAYAMVFVTSGLTVAVGADAQVASAGSGASPVPAGESVDLVLSLQGGISYGAYQAGVNQAILDIARRSNRGMLPVSFGGIPTFRLAALVGASAGNINGFLSAVSWCREIGQVESSILWRIWISTGIEQLLRPVGIRLSGTLEPLEPDATGVFHRSFYEQHFAALNNLLGPAPVSPECRQPIPVGITLTRQYPDTVNVGKVPAPVQRFVTAFRLVPDCLDPIGDELDDCDANPSRLHWRLPTDRLLGERSVGKIIALQTDEHARIVPDALYTGIAASSAFPVAFGPIRLRYRVPRDSSGELEPTYRQDWFLDGGFFDNNPLHLAFMLHKMEFAHDDAAGQPESLNGGRPLARPRAAKHMQVIFIDPGRRRPDTVVDGPDSTATHFGFDELLHLLSTAITPARKYELHSMARFLTKDEQDAVHATSRFAPVYGGTLQAFGAFLGRPLRESDFYAGFYDGLNFMIEAWFCRSAPDAVRHGCTHARLQEAIHEYKSNNWISSGGASILQSILDSEFVAVDSHPPSLQRGSSVASMSKRDSVLAVVHRASFLLDAAALRRSTSSDWCDNEVGTDKLICASGLLEAFNRIDEAHGPWIKEQATRPECEPAKYAHHFDNECFVDSTFDAMVRNSRESTLQLARNALWRVRGLAELKTTCLKRQRDGSDCVTRFASTISPANEERLAEFGLALIELPRPAPTITFNHTKVPPRLRILQSFPTSWSVGINDRAWDISVRYPLRFRKEVLGVGVGASAEWGLGHMQASDPLRIAPLLRGPALHHIVTIGLEFRPLKAAGIEGGMIRRDKFLWTDERLQGWWARVNLMDLLSVGVERLRIDGESSARLNVGLLNAIGTIYWLQRFTS